MRAIPLVFLDTEFASLLEPKLLSLDLELLHDVLVRSAYGVNI